MNFTKCLVKKCRNRAYPGTTLKFHPLPKDPSKQREWLSNLNPKQFVSDGWEACALVCGDHFKPEHYDERNRLLEDAVPIKITIQARRRRCWYSGVDKTPSSTEDTCTCPKDNTNQPDVETLSTRSNEADSPTENNTPSSTEDTCTGTKDNTNQPDVETLSTRSNEADSPPENNEPVYESNESGSEDRNESHGSDSEAYDNMEEIETVVEIEDDENVPESIRGFIYDWEGPGSPTITPRADVQDNVMHTDDDLGVQETIKACRVCLAMDGKMFRLQTLQHRQMYTDATGIPIAADDVFPHFLCWECAGRVSAIAKFRTKARAARHVLMGILYDYGKISMQSVQSINRREYKLTSQLSEKHIKPNQYIRLNEIQLKNVSDIMTHNDNEPNVENIDAVGDNFDAEDRSVLLFDENELIPDRTLIDLDIDMTENNTDILTSDIMETNIDVNLNDIMGNNIDIHTIDIMENNADVYTNYIIENNTDVHKSNVIHDKDVDVNDVQETDEDSNETVNARELTKRLRENKVTREAKLKKAPECLNHFTITTLTKEEEIGMRLCKKWKGPYRCDICHRSYTMQSTYEKHVLRHTEKYGKFECDICKIRMPRANIILMHKRAYHGKKYTCNKCAYSTLNLTLAKRHFIKHTFERLECPHCSKIFSRRAAFYEHLRKGHLCGIPCERCGENFPTATGKNRHQKLVHSKDTDKMPLEGPHCDVCDVTFASRDAHDTHLARSSKHNDEETFSNQNEPKYIKYLKDFTITTLTKDLEMAEMQSREGTYPPYTCEVCYRGYTKQFCYEEHILKHTEKYGTFECDICKIRKRTEAELQKHMRGLHRKRFTCNKCGYATTYASRARYHHIHHGDVKIHKCPHCAKEFSRVSTYRGHLRTNHLCDWACEYCGHTFRSQNGKLHHQNMTHRSDKDTTPLEGPHCDTCDVTFASRDAHDKHLAMSSRHNDDTTSKIVNIYNRPKLRARRRRREQESVNVTCEECDQTLPSIRMYLSHFKRDHPRLDRTQYTSATGTRTTGYRYICEHCGAKFKVMTLLEDHMTIHTGEHFECHDCGKIFLRKSLLAYHIVNVHSGKRKMLKCTACPKLLSTPTSLYKHFRAYHTTFKPHVCAACGMRFILPSLLRAHIDHVHNRVPYPKRNQRRVRKKQ